MIYPSFHLYRLNEIFPIQTYQQSENYMPNIPRNNSSKITSYTRLSSNCQPKNPKSFRLKQNWLKKSMFNPSVGLAQAFATRRHLAGVNVPRVQIIHSCPRWLLLQAPQVKANFFQVLKKGKLGNLEQHLLKLFKSFVSLTKSYGFFRPTQKMIFMERMEFKVWINEDIFSNKPLMPIQQGKDSQKHFVIAFLAMLSACLEGWQKISNITTIEQTLMVLQWRCKLARGKLSAVNASQCTNFKPEESQISFNPSELGKMKNLITSQQINHRNLLEDEKQIFSNSFTLNDESIQNRVRNITFFEKNCFECQKAQSVDQNSLRQTNNKFGLHSTSSTLGRFSEMFKMRSTMGKTNCGEKLQWALTRESTPQIPLIQLQIENLFADEDRQTQEEHDQEYLQRIAQEMQEILIW